MKLEFKHEDGFCTEQGRKIDELLKKIGVEFESYMVWMTRTNDNHNHSTPFLLTRKEIEVPFDHDLGEKYFNHVSAFSCAELGFLLPGYAEEQGEYWLNKDEETFNTGYETKYDDHKYEAQAKADIFIQGLEEGWINKDNIGK